MIEVHFLHDDGYEFSDERPIIEGSAVAAEAEARRLLPGLAQRLHLLVVPGTNVIDVTGEVGYAMGPSIIKWTVDVNRSLHETATRHLSHSLLHECFHAARLRDFPGEAYTLDWKQGAVCEGLATVFEREHGGFDPPWGHYDPDTVIAWAQELFGQPVDHNFATWKFNHPDGRRWIAYKVGTWLVDRALSNSAQTITDLVYIPVPEILEMAASRRPLRKRRAGRSG